MALVLFRTHSFYFSSTGSYSLGLLRVCLRELWPKVLDLVQYGN